MKKRIRLISGLEPPEGEGNGYGCRKPKSLPLQGKVAEHSEVG